MTIIRKYGKKENKILKLSEIELSFLDDNLNQTSYALAEFYGDVFHKLRKKIKEALDK